MGDKGREDPRKSGHAIQQEKTRRGTMRDTGRQDPHTIQHQGGHLKKVLRTPNSTLLGEQEGRQGETRGDKTLGKGDIQQRETKRGTIGDKGRQKGRQGETRGDKTLGKADTPSNKREQQLAQWETRPSGR